MDHVLSVLHTLIPFVPTVVVACVAYLVFNDALDVALVVKREQRKFQVADAIAALTNDLANKQVAAGVITAVFPVVVGGGDIRALAVAALVGVAAANVGNLEASTRTKLKTLFGAPAPLSQPIPLPKPPV